MKISDKIVEHRKLKGLTQEELAGKSNISLRTLQRIENDENTPRGKTLQLICESMEIRLEDLQNDDLDQKPSITYTLFNYFFLVCLNLIQWRFLVTSHLMLKQTISAGLEDCCCPFLYLPSLYIIHLN